MAGLADLVDECTAAFDTYDYARAIERTEAFFWSFCDDYLELVKNRAYGAGPGGASATGALQATLSTLLRLFAPFLPFVTEEVWSWWQEGSIHQARWPDAQPLRAASKSAAGDTLAAAADVLAQVRKAKSEAKVSMRAPVERVIVRDQPAVIEALQAAAPDLRDAGTIADLVLLESDDPSVDVTLAPTPREG
jgi:valyl-tRNA synthetase